MPKTIQVEDIFRYRRRYIQVADEDALEVNQYILLKREKDNAVVRVTKLLTGENFQSVDEKSVFEKVLTDKEVNELYELQDGELERVQKARVLAEKLKIDMHFFAAKIGWKGQQNIFYFSSPEPVDFRELLKDMIKTFKGRIQLERVVDRDRALMLDGSEMCGGRAYPFLKSNNQKIPLDAVRDQGIVIKNNPKIFDASGKIKPSMIYELPSYRQNRRYLPHIQQVVTLKETGKKGKVTGLDILNHRCKVFFDELGIIEFCHVDDLEFNNKREIPENLKAPVAEIDIEARIEELEKENVEN